MAFPENATEIRVPDTNRISGSQIEGSRGRSRESSSVANASPSSICEAAIENSTVTAEPNVNHRAASNREAEPNQPVRSKGGQILQLQSHEMRVHSSYTNSKPQIRPMRYRYSILLLLALSSSAGAGETDGAMFDQTVRPFLARYCLQCHSAKVRTANLDLEAYRNAASATKGPGGWEQVLTKLRTGQMPPNPMPRPSAAEIAAVTRWIDGALAAASPAKPEPGRLTAHRLNRFEYNNTVHDLLAVDFRPADDFPADDSGYGFDNIGDVLSLSPVLMEKYLNAAEKIARLAIAADPPLKPTLERHRADKLDQVGPELALRHRFPVEGDYDLRFNLTGRRPKKVPQHLVVDLSLDGQPLRHFDVSVEEDKPRIFEERFHIHAGERALKVEVIKDEPLPETLPPNVPNQVQVDYLEIRGPYNQVAPPPPESHKRVFVCGHANGHHTEACGRQIVANLARRAWRRPVSEREVDQLLSFVEMARKQGDSFEQGIRVALQAILVSPHFLFRIERDPPSTEPGSVRAVSPFE